MILPAHRFFTLGIALSIATATTVLRGQGAAQALPLGLPEQSAAAAGFAAERLERVQKFLAGEVGAGRYAGATWLVARDGKVAAHGATGFRDLEKQEPMTEDTAVRIYSMSKIITSVAALTLLEEGRFNLDDNVARYLPEFAKLQVYKGGTADSPELVPIKRAITIRHLLTHTSGFAYDVLGRDLQLREIYKRENLWRSTSLAEFATKAARLPLAHQPGEAWTYGINTDILGALIEAVARQPLETVMRERIFQPLHMTETAFRPPASTQGRLARIYERKEGALKAVVPFGVDFSDLGGTFASGGGGLVSTLHDYARFAQMLLNGGELDGARVLGRKTVELMTRNHVGHLVPRPAGTPSGFGLGVSVQADGADTARSLSSPGQFGWSGAAGTYVSIDPHERTFVLLLVQHIPGNEDGLSEKFHNTVYQALVK